MFAPRAPLPLTSPTTPVVSVERSRLQTIERLTCRDGFDVVVIGGGVHGACAAWVACLNGLRVALLERGSYAEDTSSRSSGMLHGGLRYLRTGDLAQVFEGVNAREEWLQIAPHLTRATEFLIPVYKGELQKQFLLKAALTAYDALAFRSKLQLHRWRDADTLEARSLFSSASELKGGYAYRDGQMHGGQIVREILLAARLSGAITLNHADVKRYQTCDSSKAPRKFEVTWRDALSGKEHTTRSCSVVNCAGPAVALLGEAVGHDTLAFSQGSHLLFDFPWRGPALTLPIGPILDGRCYFVLPYSVNGHELTLVGTTEHKLTGAKRDYAPSTEEINEILGRLKKDLSGSPLTRDRIIGAYAGTRTLLRPSANAGTHTANLARSSQWAVGDDGHSTHLVGGKWTNAQYTAHSGISQVWKALGRRGKPSPIAGHPLPGAHEIESAVRTFTERCSSQGISEKCRDGAIARLGSLVALLGDTLTELPGEILREEVTFAINHCQVTTVWDAALWFELEKFPSERIQAERLNSLVRTLKEVRPSSAVAEEETIFTTRQHSVLAGIMAKDKSP